jgi:raffinose/stachyose/melibiose transport system substrate-binding protein
MTNSTDGPPQSFPPYGTVWTKRKLSPRTAGDHSTQQRSNYQSRLARLLVRAVPASLLVVATAAVPCGAASAGTPATTTGSVYDGHMTYWFWGEGDIPGITKWMDGRISAYERLHPQVSITLVPQSNNTLIGAFQAAAETNQGPDIETQWATVPTLTAAWNHWAVPIQDYVPASEIKNWISTQENVYKGQVWAMPLYLLGTPLIWNKSLFAKAGLNPNAAPATWAEFLADCAALKSHGITPFGFGNTGGNLAAFFVDQLALQNLNNVGQFMQEMLGKTPVSTAPYAALQELIKKGYINSNVSSLSISQGWQLFPEQKVAMTIASDGDALLWGQSLGTKNIGVGKYPKWGNGALADKYSVSQSSDEFITSWSHHKSEAATFLVWLHQPQNLLSLHEATGAFPADRRFPTADITGALAKQLYALDQLPSVWLEDWVPATLSASTDGQATQIITSGSGGLPQVEALWKSGIQHWKFTLPADYKAYQQWAATVVGSQG